MSLSKEEMQADLAATERDISALTEIKENLETFIHQPHGEDRGFLRVDLMRYSSLLASAKKLKVKIERKLAGA